ncbi:carbohydrate ABC transporter permease [Amnibacterium sp.]|uniref:carbohydrate ABC transporter permease n=1 Tax=Amnibacterium sp. TaxID=1872496 RepID=UPI0026193AE3|nr:sugar ABC transporter permease [Amnibacterium sp.]MCU1472687.1 ABC-type sugar transport system, permease component [Amnibacterium sp.]
MTTATRSLVAAGAPGRGARWRRKHLTFDKVSFAVVFLGVPLVLYVVLVLSPFVQAVVYSLTSWTGFDTSMTFVGLANYVNAFTDPTFQLAVRNSVELVIVLPIVVIALALALASLVTIGGPSNGQVRGVRFGEFYRIVFFFPYIIPAIATGIMWNQVFDPSNGLLNGVLTSVGLKGFASYPWLGDTRTAMVSTMFVMAWASVGFYMVIFVAAIKALPAEIYEAARLDGASRLRIALRITVPMLRSSIRTSLIYTGIFALDAFVFMSALNPGGGPDDSTLVISQELFKSAFTKGQFGLACAMGVVLAGITLLFAAIVFLVDRITGGRETAGE